MILKIWKLISQSKRPERKTKVVNIYIKQVRKSCTWDVRIHCIWGALGNVNWAQVI